MVNYDTQHNARAHRPEAQPVLFIFCCAFGRRATPKHTTVVHMLVVFWQLNKARATRARRVRFVELPLPVATALKQPYIIQCVCCVKCCVH